MRKLISFSLFLSIVVILLLARTVEAGAKNDTPNTTYALYMR